MCSLYVLEVFKWNGKFEIIFYWYGFKIFKIWNDFFN